jgi:hypothetical protein
MEAKKKDLKEINVERENNKRRTKKDKKKDKFKQNEAYSQVYVKNDRIANLIMSRSPK